MRDRLRILTESMRAFCETSIDPAVLLETIVRRVATVVGDACSVLLVADDGVTLQTLATHCVDETAERLAAETMIAEPIEISRHPILARVLATGEPFVAPRIDLEALRPPRTTARWFAFAQAIGLHGRTFSAVLPREVRPGGAVGA